MSIWDASVLIDPIAARSMKHIGEKKRLICTLVFAYINAEHNHQMGLAI